MSEELLSIKQVQTYLKVSERTVFNLISRGDLKGFKAGRSWRFRISDVQDYEDRQRQKAEQEAAKRSKDSESKDSEPPESEAKGDAA